MASLNGKGKDTLLQSLAGFTKYASIDGVREPIIKVTGVGQEVPEKANAFLRWLALEGNPPWLVILNNLDRDYRGEREDSQAYDMESFLPATDHGSLLVTTRLPHLGGFGNGTKV
ncbi:hypothetical protein OEA41_001209 [Lepraria neglecta]|uniref:Uncharacterized protein n=1 Tax=Lepraria neglecta TaxID=209136 RepID=A0AAD9ZHX3_9LECA|nr:hypothetical protein OEA41_001209 [Lepraria neglecta]